MSFLDEPTVRAQLATQEPQKEDKGGNWFTNLLPTAGGLGGAAGGAAAGSVILPGVGTVIGGILGAALGSGAGKLGENAAEGNELTKDVGTAAIEGGAGQAVGGVVGKGLSKGAQLLKGRAGKVASNQAMQKEAEDMLEKHASVYGDISKKTQENLNVRDALKHVQDLGYDIGDPQNLVHVSNNTSDVLNDLLNRSLAKTGKLDFSDYNDVVKKALAERGGTLGSFEPIAVSRGRLGQGNTPSAKLLKQLEDLGAGVAKKDADPNEIRTLITKLGKLEANAKPKVNAEGVIDPIKQDLYDVHSTVKNALKDRLYNRQELNDLIKGEIGNIVPDEKLGITKELADHINNVITKAGTGDRAAAQDLLDEISKNIDISNLGKEAAKKSQIVTSKAAKARTAEELGLGNEGLNTNPMAQVLEGPVHASLPERALSVANNVKDNPKILETLSRIGDLGAKIAPPAGVVAATSPNLGASPVAVDGAGGPGMAGPGAPGGTMGGNMIEGTGNPQQDFVDAMRAQAVLAPNLGGGAASFMSTLTPQLQKNQLLATAMGTVPEGFANAGGAQGAAGILSKISGLFPGTAAHSYEQQRQAAAQQLAQSLGISPEAAAGLLPQLMQNEASSDISQGILGNLRGQLVY